MTVPVLTEKSVRQARQRKGWGLRVGRSLTLSDPHSGQRTPSGQRMPTSSFSTAASSENMRAACMIERPFLCDLPGPLRFATAAPVRQNRPINVTIRVRVI